MNSIDIVIPTHNRPDLLRRILDYYQKYGQDLNFIIADSSNPEIKTLNKKLTSNYPILKIEYIDKFATNLNQHVKFAEMVKYVKRKYVCFCPDDDYIVPSSIKECVNFLERNPDFSAAYGNYIGFHLHRDLFGKYKFWWRDRYTPHSIASSDPLDRVISHLENFTLVLWSVRRTKIVKKSYEEFLKAKIDPYLLIIFGELLPDVLTVLFGKIKWLNIFYGARQYFGSIAYDFASLIDAKNDGKYNIEYNKFKRCILRNLSKLDNISLDEASRALDSVMEKYMRSSYQEHLSSKIYLFLRRYPKFISKGIRSLHAKYLFSKSSGNTMRLDSPSSKYFNDFDAIRRSVLENKI